MAKRVYFDSCCLNRPFDDQSQARIRLETEAVIHLLRGVEGAKIIWINSDAIVYEVLKCPDEADARRFSPCVRVCQNTSRLTMRPCNAPENFARKVCAMSMPCILPVPRKARSRCC